jgi:hypothetical protein
MPENDEPDSKGPARPSQLKGFLLSVLILAAWTWGLNWLFTRVTDGTYFRWYVQNGTLIGIATAFMALVWQGLEAQKGLLSWHPGRFLASCMALAAVFYATIAVNLAGPLDGLKRRAEDSVSILEALWDAVCAVLMALLMGVAVLGWVVVIAPLYYLVTLVTGAPARREIRDTGRRLVVQTEGFTTTILEQPSSVAVPENAVDVSFGVRPFALTNALNAAVLFAAKLLLPATG